MNTLLKRTLFGAIFVIVMVGSLLLGFPYFSGVIILLTGISLIELYHIFKKATYQPNLLIIMLVGLLSLAISILQIQGILIHKRIWLLPLGIAFLSFVFELFNQHHRPMENVAVSVFSWFYILVPFILILHLTSSYELVDMGYEMVYTPYKVLSIFILMWSYDSFAYLAGSKFGKHKMAEKISPKKSWEGFIGGVTATILISILVSYLWDPGHLLRWIIIAIITAIFGTFGDLFESKLKRQAGIKDSGNVIPGHGGILDRFDAILLVVPFVYIYLEVLDPLIYPLSYL